MFDEVYAFTAKWEGGLSDHPSDSGGITNYGVSRAFLKTLEHEARPLLRELGILLPVSPESVRALTRSQAKALFRHEFWDKPGFYNYPYPVALAGFDCAVNSGNARSIACLQEACNLLGQKLLVDGILGSRTKKALEDCSRLNPKDLALHAINARLAFLNRLVAAKPSQKVFQKGWLNRVNDLKRQIM